MVTIFSVKISIFFSSKTAIHLFLSLYEGLPATAYRRSLLPSKSISSTS
jgi:hypothetical protein